MAMKSSGKTKPQQARQQQASAPDEGGQTAHFEKTLFHDAIESTVASVHIFTLIRLRKLAKTGKLDEEDANKLLDLPVSNSRLLVLSEKYGDMLTKFRDKNYLDMEETFQSATRRPTSSPTALAYFIGDELADEECAYIMGRDEFHKRIFLIFRGSITLTDWYQDFKLMISKVPNPATSFEEEQPEEIGIHLGFRNYLFGPPGSLVDAFKNIMPTMRNLTNSKNVADDDAAAALEKENGEQLDDENSEDDTTTTKTKMEVICDQLRSMKERFPDDTIFLCGHSLGGALALITSLCVAADSTLNFLPGGVQPGYTPVTCLAIGNPKPGDRAFTNAIYCLERKRKLRCCCFHNYLDIVPMMPPNIALSDAGFWHPGFRVLLYKHRYELGRGDSDTPMAYTYSGCCRKESSGWSRVKRFSRDSSSSKEYVTKQRVNLHNFREYMERILNLKDGLVGLSLKGFYQDLWKKDEEKAINKL